MHFDFPADLEEKNAFNLREIITNHDPKATCIYSISKSEGAGIQGKEELLIGSDEINAKANKRISQLQNLLIKRK